MLVDWRIAGRQAGRQAGKLGRSLAVYRQLWIANLWVGNLWAGELAMWLRLL